MTTEIPRILIAAPSSGSGKTTVTLTLLDHFTQNGKRVQPFKVGPDYIDPNFHQAVTGQLSYNLDSWMESPAEVSSRFFTVSGGRDLAIIEGVMGLFDGKDADSLVGSSCHLAALIKAPILLVVDVSAMARSAAAVVLGFQIMAQEAGCEIAGVICNRVGSESHYLLVKEAIESVTKVPCFGYLLKDSQIEMPERQLGLRKLSGEQMATVLERLRLASATSINFAGIEQIANKGSTQVSEREPSVLSSPRAVGRPPAKRSQTPYVALAYDEAFWFYYPANLDMLRMMGAVIMPFSPLAGEPIPRQATHLYWGGGFPEQYLSALARHAEQLVEYRHRILDGLMTLAECGGNMALHQEITGLDGVSYPMIGVVPGGVLMTERLSALGYRTIEVQERQHPLFGTRWRGHEFHYSRESSAVASANSPAYQVSGRGRSWSEGYARERLLSGYPHFYFPSNPEGVEKFLSLA